VGFLDSMKAGLSRVGGAVGGFFETVGEVGEALAPVILPPLAEALATRAAQELLPGAGAYAQPIYRTNGGYTYRPPAARTPAPRPTTRAPAGIPGVPVPWTPIGPDERYVEAAFPTAPYGGAPRPAAGSGGYMPAFPVSRAEYTGPSIGIPGTEYELRPDLPLVDIAPRQGGAVGGVPVLPYRRTPMGAAAQKFVAVNPVTNRATWFGPLGQPVLFSRDFAVCRRVNRIARRARRATGRR
jgi:hypothetical protein